MGPGLLSIVTLLPFYAPEGNQSFVFVKGRTGFSHVFFFLIVLVNPQRDQAMHFFVGNFLVCLGIKLWQLGRVAAL